MFQQRGSSTFSDELVINVGLACSVVTVLSIILASLSAIDALPEDLQGIVLIVGIVAAVVFGLATAAVWAYYLYCKIQYYSNSTTISDIESAPTLLNQKQEAAGGFIGKVHQEVKNETSKTKESAKAAHQKGTSTSPLWYDRAITVLTAPPLDYAEMMATANQIEPSTFSPEEISRVGEFLKAFDFTSAAIGLSTVLQKSHRPHQLVVIVKALRQLGKTSISKAVESELRKACCRTKDDQQEKQEIVGQLNALEMAEYFTLKLA